MNKTPAEVAASFLEKRDRLAADSADKMRPSFFGRACETVLQAGKPLNKTNLIAELILELERSNVMMRPACQSALDLLAQSPD